MQALISGHRYELDFFENPKLGQEVQFIHKEPQGEDGELATIRDGTTNEEVLRMMIDRMEFLQERMPCRENELVIENLRDALGLLEQRTRDREERGVEGTHKP